MEQSAAKICFKFPLFSLKKMSLIKITTMLCSASPVYPSTQTILSLISDCDFDQDYDRRLYTRRGPSWSDIHKWTNDLISEIFGHCPRYNEMILESLWPVCYRIMLWKSIYLPRIHLTFSHCRFYWTDQGRIDNRRTARSIISKENISARQRFVLACSLCLGVEIYEIWQEMSIEDKMYCFDAESGVRFRPLVLFWAHNMQGSGDLTEQCFMGACTCAFDNGLIDALKYFFALATKDGRKNMASTFMRKIVDKIENCSYLETDELYIAHFLFHEMSEERQYFMSGIPLVQMTFLLHFSDRGTFLDALEHNLQSYGYLGSVVYPLLNMIFYNFHLEMDQDDFCRQIFMRVWRRTTASLKNDFVTTDAGACFLCSLIRDNFPFLLRKGACEKIARLNSRHLEWKPRSSATPFRFHRDKWEFMHFLIEEGVATVSALKWYKNDMIDILKIRKSNKAAWNRVLRFVEKVASEHQQ